LNPIDGIIGDQSSGHEVRSVMTLWDLVEKRNLGERACGGTERAKMYGGVKRRERMSFKRYCFVTKNVLKFEPYLGEQIRKLMCIWRSLEKVSQAAPLVRLGKFLGRALLYSISIMT
jgi:hypothetical protein